jgi:hypothetical protein
LFLSRAGIGVESCQDCGKDPYIIGKSMAVAEQQISPEEKLLKVIQNGGEVEKQPTPEEKMLSAVKPPSPSPSVPKPPKIEPVTAQKSAVIGGVVGSGEAKPQVSQPKSPPAVKSEARSQKSDEKAAPPAISPAKVESKAKPASQKSEPPAKPASPKPAPVATSSPPPKPSAPIAAAEPPAKKASEPQKPAEPTKAVPPKKEEKKPTETKAPEADEKAKLKVLKSEPAAEAKEPPAKTLIGMPAPGDAGGGGTTAVVGKRRARRTFTIGIVNRALVAAVLLVLGLAGYEIWAAVKASGAQGLANLAVAGSGEVSGVGTDVPQREGDGDVPTLASFVDPWKNKDVFNRVVVGSDQPPGSTDVEKKLQPGGGGALAGRLKLMGFSRPSEQEAKAILWDTKDARMFIAKAGEKILVGEQQLELVQMQEDHVVLSDGRDSFPVK